VEELVRTPLKHVFNKRRVLVTGDTGFKGSWLCLWLSQLGAQVTGFALPPEHEDDHFNLLRLDRTIRHISGDIRDLAALNQALQESEPEILFHLAAQPLVRRSYDLPKLTFDTNIGGSVNILESVRSTPSLKAMIYVTSDKCYRNKEWLWGYREMDELGGRDPYSASKAAAELVFAAYQDSFFSRRENFGAASVRAGNVIGGGDWSVDRIVPDCIRSLRSGQPIVLRNPGATRPWQHVLDPLYGYLTTAAALLREPSAFSGSWNFGPDDRAIRTVNDLAHTIVGFWGSGNIQAVEQKQAPHEATLLQLNCDKAHQRLHWHPQWDFNRAVKETVRWYWEISAGTPAQTISVKQITEYMEAIHD